MSSITPFGIKAGSTPNALPAPSLSGQYPQVSQMLINR